jgi:hypothetical protein
MRGAGSGDVYENGRGHGQLVLAQNGRVRAWLLMQAHGWELGAGRAQG